jgi:hypothetical protein
MTAASELGKPKGPEPGTQRVAVDEGHRTKALAYSLGSAFSPVVIPR